MLLWRQCDLVRVLEKNKNKNKNKTQTKVYRVDLTKKIWPYISTWHLTWNANQTANCKTCFVQSTLISCIWSKFTFIPCSKEKESLEKSVISLYIVIFSTYISNSLSFLLISSHSLSIIFFIHLLPLFSQYITWKVINWVEWFSNLCIYPLSFTSDLQLFFFFKCILFTIQVTNCEGWHLNIKIYLQ